MDLRAPHLVGGGTPGWGCWLGAPDLGLADVSSGSGGCWFGRELTQCGRKNTHLEAGFLPCLLTSSQKHFGSIDMYSAQHRVGSKTDRRGLSSRSSLCVCVCACVSHSVVSSSLWSHGLYPPGSSVHGISQNTGVDCPFPSAGDIPNPGFEPRSPTLQADSFPLSHQGSPAF